MKTIQIKIKLVTYIVAILWLILAARLVVEQFFKYSEQNIINTYKITEAFTSTETRIDESSVEATAYLADDLTDHEKKSILVQLANDIGITSGYTLDTSDNKGMIQTKLVKDGLHGNEELYISTNASKQQYLHIIIHLLDNPENAVGYQNILKKSLNKLNVSKIQTYIKFNSIHNGRLSQEEEKECAEELLSKLNAKSVYESNENNMYINYAYSKEIDEYLICNYEKININIVMNYNEKKNTTEINLATPICNEDF